MFGRPQFLQHQRILLRSFATVTFLFIILCFTHEILIPFAKIFIQIEMTNELMASLASWQSNKSGKTMRMKKKNTMRF